MKHMRRLFCTGGILAICLVALLMTSGCGGGGGGSSTDTANSEAAGQYGKVGILLTDGPADEYEHIWVTITEVSLLPAGSDNGTVIFSSADGYRFDLLAYRDEDFLLRLNENVPVGTYEKVRLKVLRVEAQGGECNEMDIDVPSGKIDLNPQGSFEVRADTTLYIRLDIDANKSINLHPAGSSDRCKFRPVVFVDIISRGSLPECPIFMKGEVSTLHNADEDPYPESFTLIRGEDACLESVNVLIDEDTLVFTGNGVFGSSLDIANGQRVTVRGRVADGCIRADLIIIGDVLRQCGIVRGPVSSTGFTLEYLDYSPAPPTTRNVGVVLDGLTPKVSGCNTPVQELHEGMYVLVLGKVVNGKINAAIVFVKPYEYSGTTSSIEEDNDGYYLTITLDSGGTERIFISQNTLIVIEGDGLFPYERITLLGLHEYTVKVFKKYDGTLFELRIVPDRVAGVVEVPFDLLERFLVVQDETRGCDVRVAMSEFPIGIDTTGDGDCLISPYSIDENDVVTCFGFWRVSGGIEEFLTFVFIIDDKVLEADF